MPFIWRNSSNRSFARRIATKGFFLGFFLWYVVTHSRVYIKGKLVVLKAAVIRTEIEYQMCFCCMASHDEKLGPHVQTN